MMRLINIALKPLRRKVRQLVSRGVVTLIDPNQLMQTLQVELLKGEVLDDVEHFEPYGFTSHAPGEPEVLTVSLNGQRSHTIALVVANRLFRLQGLANGEIAINTDEGDVIHFKRGNHILIDAMTKITAKAPNVDIIANTKVTMTTPHCDISGKLTVGETIAAVGNVSSAAQMSDATGSMQSMRDIYDSHGHPDLNTPPTEKMN